jgi:hypothetical protein
VKVRGVGTLRVCLREQTRGQEMLWDLQSELRIVSTHREYVRLLNQMIADGGLGIQAPAYLMERNRRTGEIAQGRRRVADYLEAFVESAELVVPGQAGDARR